MDTISAIKEAAKAAGIPTTHIGPAMGKTAPYVANSAARGSTPKCDTAAAMLAVCGYALAAVPVTDLPASALVIDPPDSLQ